MAGHEFEVAALVLGGMLVVGALTSGLASRSILSLTALALVVGFILGRGGFNVLHFHARSTFVGDLATVALVVILFRDGLEVEWEMLQTEWRLPLRKLVLAMPLTAAIIAVTTHAVTDLSWTNAFLLGALLSPTDPVLSTSVVTNPRVPRFVRHSLNLESGLNDGLALPAVLALLAALTGSAGFVWWRFVLENIGLGLVWGIAVGLLASVALPVDRHLGSEIPPHQRALYALGVAFLTYGTSLVPPHGNGLIAVYVAAITLGVRRPDITAYFRGQSEDIVEIVKIGVFVVFGSLLTLDMLFSGGWSAVAIVAVTLLVARPVAVLVALVRTRTDLPTRLFMAWFGPKGVATITFSLLVFSAMVPAGERLFHYAALAVFCSIIAHGLTDTPGANWIARHSERQAEAGSSATTAGNFPRRTDPAAQ